ncbi:hypothetical protein [uncultured Microbacterium sp.]|nr:hypothetical protein [uncultured Microbacterium sp.]
MARLYDRHSETGWVVVSGEVDHESAEEIWYLHNDRLSYLVE